MQEIIEAAMNLQVNIETAMNLQVDIEAAMNLVSQNNKQFLIAKSLHALSGSSIIFF